ncbi:uncharacterized protein BYT42DRAFT_550761 [Radiomyces spectabilis]|uniref:uncharacterized protein n=1 Tax=Radiomyces spectabilis TaxID=64574 RepID=UPI00221E78BA|nr:uncharacterized protein BYT42DRAFT_550761 [Radiomyces spectabilis]KAI8393360.1 hypothetical protein BYT42DRAFT_550761 [Radiomyces spectabilis]
MASKVTIPTEPTPNLVVVTNIHKTTQDKAIREFFLFCGKIKEFELQPDGEHQKALIMFERASAAKTAVLLSNALVDNEHIHVEPYFAETQNNEKAGAAVSEEEGKEVPPVSSTMAEMLAAGYTLTDNVLAKGIEYDNKYGLSQKVQQFFAQIQQNLAQLGQKYHVTDRAMEVDSKLGVQNKAQNVATTAQQKAEELMQSPAGQKVQGFATQMLDQINALHAEARRIADERKGTSTGATTEAPKPHTA